MVDSEGTEQYGYMARHDRHRCLDRAGLALNHTNSNESPTFRAKTLLAGQCGGQASGLATIAYPATSWLTTVWGGIYGNSNHSTRNNQHAH